MDLGVYFFSTAYSIDISELAKELEQRGFESLLLPEHTHIPVSRKTPWPGGGDLTKDSYLVLAVVGMWMKWKIMVPNIQTGLNS